MQDKLKELVTSSFAKKKDEEIPWETQVFENKGSEKNKN